MAKKVAPSKTKSPFQHREDKRRKCPHFAQKLSMTYLVITYIQLVEKYRPDIILKNRKIKNAQALKNETK